MDRSRNRPLKVGFDLPPFEDLSGSSHRWSEMLAMARRAEEVGFDSLWLPDHLIFRFAGQPEQGAFDAWSVLCALAASTSRVELGTFVLCTAWRNPALIAKMADTADEISGGRLVLGIGAGWHQPEFDAFGFPFDHRYSRFEEAIQIISALLRTGQIDFTGRFYQARDCELRPRGPRSSGPPIMVGTVGDRMIGLTARYADVWNIPWYNQPSEMPDWQAKMDAACDAAGRDRSAVVRTAGVQVDLPGHARREGANAGSPTVGGNAEEIAEALRAHARAGVSEVMIWLDDISLAGIEAFAPVLEILDRDS